MSDSAETPSSSSTEDSSPPPPENDSPPPEDSPPPSSQEEELSLSPSSTEQQLSESKLASPPSNNDTGDSSSPPPPTATSPPHSPPASKSSSKSPPPSSSSPSSSPPPKSKSPVASPPPPSSKQQTPSTSTSPPTPTNQSPPQSGASSPPPPAEKSTTKSPTTPSTTTTVQSPPPPGEFKPPPPVSSNLTPTSSNTNTTSTTTASPQTPSATSPSSNGSSSSSGHSSTSSSNSSKSSTTSSSSNENDASSDDTSKAIIGAVIVGAVLIVAITIFFIVKKKKKKHDMYNPHYMPPPNFSVQADGYYYGAQPTQMVGYSNAANYSYGSQPSHSPESFGSLSGESGVIGGAKTNFSYEEVMEMTNGFSRENVVGEGGFGCVYRGQVQDGKAVAVKQLKIGSGQGDREFKAEVEIISRVHHKHLVTLVGYCIADRQRLLLYEFVPNKTLEHHLHSKGMPVLEWTKRLKIAVGAAKGLAYLHEDCNPKIIHRDIKSANILLDEHFEALVADFGLARLNDTTQTHVSTRVMGTFGYLAPEYASTGKLTDRSDVFSFGVVLLELITGRKPVDTTQPLGEESLVEWARPILIRAVESRDLSEIVDPRLKNHYVESELFRMVETAAACVRHSAPKRPSMVQVVRALDNSEEMSDLTNGVKYGQSTAYDSGLYNEEIMRFRRTAFSSEDSSEFNLSSGEYTSRQVSHGPPVSDYLSPEIETRAMIKSEGNNKSGRR